MDAAEFSREMKSLLASKISGQKINDEQLLRTLNKVQNNTLPKEAKDEDKLAFWLNLYNGFTNWKLLFDNLRQSVKEQPDFFTEKGIMIEGVSLSLDDIEHGILRHNRPRKNGITLNDWSSPTHTLFHMPFDYRIHFALNCGARSCPPIAFYQGCSLDAQLSMAEAHFISEGFMVDLENRIIECNAIFNWYRDDFEHGFLNDSRYLDFEVHILPYNWNFI